MKIFSILFLITSLILSLPLISPVNATGGWVYWGDLGNHLNCRIETEMELKVGTDVNVTLIFNTDDLYNIQIGIIEIQIQGAGIYFPSTSVVDTQVIAQNVNVSKSSSFNATYTIKPTEEGAITCWIRAIYNATEFAFPDIKTSEWVSRLLVLGYARAIPYNDLWLYFLIFFVATLILLAVDIILIIMKIRGRYHKVEEPSVNDKKLADAFLITGY
jgi:hypothetical protein